VARRARRRGDGGHRRVCGGSPAAGWWDTIRPHSFGWVAARDRDGRLVDFEPQLRSSNFDGCGFDPTDAGLIRLRH
jgi:hypothetical protein